MSDDGPVDLELTRTLVESCVESLHRTHGELAANHFSTGVSETLAVLQTLERHVALLLDEAGVVDDEREQGVDLDEVIARLGRLRSGLDELLARVEGVGLRPSARATPDDFTDLIEDGSAFLREPERADEAHTRRLTELVELIEDANGERLSREQAARVRELYDDEYLFVCLPDLMLDAPMDRRLFNDDGSEPRDHEQAGVESESTLDPDELLPPSAYITTKGPESIQGVPGLGDSSQTTAPPMTRAFRKFIEAEEKPSRSKRKRRKSTGEHSVYRPEPSRDDHDAADASSSPATSVEDDAHEQDTGATPGSTEVEGDGHEDGASEATSVPPAAIEPAEGEPPTSSSSSPQNDPSRAPEHAPEEVLTTKDDVEEQPQPHVEIEPAQDHLGASESEGVDDISELNPSSLADLDASVARQASLALECMEREGGAQRHASHVEQLCLLLASRSRWHAATMLAGNLEPVSPLRDFLECGELASVGPMSGAMERRHRITAIAQNPPNPAGLSHHADGVQTGCAMMLAACALEDAFYVNPTLWASTLEQLSFGADHPGLGEMIEELARSLVRGVPLTPELIATGSNTSALNRALEELCATVESRREETSQRTISLQRATEVWRKMTFPDGLVGESAALMTTLVDTNDGVERLHEILAVLEDTRELEQEVERLNQQYKRGAEAIEAKALKKIHREASEWAKLCKDALDLRERLDQTSSNAYQYEYADRVRDTLATHMDSVLEELEHTAATDAWMAAGARVLADVLGRVGPGATTSTQVVVDDDETPIEVTLARARALEWLGFEGFTYDDSGSLLKPYDWSEFDPPAQGPDADADVDGIRVALKALSTQPLEASDRLEGTIDRGDIVTAHQIGDWLPSPDDTMLEHLARREDELRVELGGRLDKNEDLYHKALREGLLTEHEASMFSSLINEASNRLGDRNHPQRFDALAELITWLRDHLEEKFEHQVESLSTRLGRLDKDTVSPADLERVRSVLEGTQLRTAEEYLTLLEKGDPLPQSRRDDRFDQFFGAAFDPRDRMLQETGLPRIQGMLKRRQASKEALDFSGLNNARVEEAVRALKAWTHIHECTKERCDIGICAHLKRVFEFLGFEEVEVVPKNGETSGTTKPEFVMRAIPLGDRAICSLPRFGSRAQGQYYVYLNTKRVRMDELVEGLDRPATEACFVFDPRPLRRKERRELALACHANQKTLVVLDTNLLCWLATLDVSMRLRHAFDAALPFTWAMPFEDNAGDVAPELFYGRRDQIRRITQERKGGVIYGGRQLGKTALLKHVESTANSLEDRQHYVFRDLRTEELLRDSKQFANFLRDMLQSITLPEGSEPLLPKSLTSATSTRSLLIHVVEYLNRHPSAQIVLLLDEADEFLSAEEESGFMTVVEITNAQSNTGGRFRVFFAGLHDVQRSIKEPNHPLAHMSNSINIGPLYEDREYEQALALLIEPLASLGYVFDGMEGDLPMTVLTYTNFYPSLIQLFGLRLLEHIHKGKSTSWMGRKSPPYVIRRKHVEGALESEQLRKQIHEKFRLTLQLDPRYEFLTYATVFEGSGELGVADPGGGVPISTLHQTGRDYWSDEFAQMEQTTLEILLDEMVGLGVLKRITPRRGEVRYALRNSNVARTLGTQEQVEHELTKPRKHRIKRYKDTCRATMSPQSSRLSPWTLKRSDEIERPVSRPVVICGPSGAGIGDVEAWLGSRAYLDVRALGVECAEPARMIEELSRPVHSSNHGGSGVTFLVLDDEASWSVDTLIAAHDKLNARRSTTHFLKPVFLLDEHRAWELCGQEDLRAQLERHADLIDLRPIHSHGIRHWAQETEFGVPDDEIINDLVFYLGVYPGTLEWFQRHVEGHDWDERRTWLNTQLEDGEVCETILTMLGAPAGSPQRSALKSVMGGEQADDRLRAWLDFMGLSTSVDPLKRRNSLDWCLEVAG